MGIWGPLNTLIMMDLERLPRPFGPLACLPHGKGMLDRVLLHRAWDGLGPPCTQLEEDSRCWRK